MVWGNMVSCFVFYPLAASSTGHNSRQIYLQCHQLLAVTCWEVQVACFCARAKPALLNDAVDTSVTRTLVRDMISC
ncbi:hypothetical protein F5Y12DRAFT_759964 [Xylaria sp. FL1777]|nr:hypothetical protein F5Y12DRAFT_759964 [Xylaria sp. FL1777]